jgi:hypothetical protein
MTVGKKIVATYMVYDYWHPGRTTLFKIGAPLPCI